MLKAPAVFIKRKEQQTDESIRVNYLKILHCYHTTFESILILAEAFARLAVLFYLMFNDAEQTM